MQMGCWSTRLARGDLSFWLFSADSLSVCGISSSIRMEGALAASLPPPQLQLSGAQRSLRAGPWVVVTTRSCEWTLSVPGFCWYSRSC